MDIISEMKWEDLQNMIKGSHHNIASKRQIGLRNLKNVELPLFTGF